MRRIAPPWINRTVVGIALATFFSDASHELCTAVLPLYLVAIGGGAGALALIEGVADFLASLSKLAGGVLGHLVVHKRGWASLGYLITSIATSAMGLVTNVTGLVTLRSIAWIGRGYRGPLRDALLTDAVEKTHYGRVFGLERTGDMLGAVTGPLAAGILVWAGIRFGSILLWALIPGLLAAASMFFLTRERTVIPESVQPPPTTPARARYPRAFYLFLTGVFAFGLGDFSRTFLIWLAAQALGENSASRVGTISIAVLLYALHNLVSAGAAYPVGMMGDRYSKRNILIAGYAVGVATNLLLACFSGSLSWLVVAIVLSGIYIAVEDTLEKSVLAEMLPRESRSLGFGLLAFTNAAGDLFSSLSVGFFLSRGRPALGFGLAATAGLAGVAWLALFVPRRV